MRSRILLGVGAISDLTPRQEIVLRAVVTAYVASGAPVGSGTLASLLPVHLSSASIRNTMAELAELGLLEKPHVSSGRVPTERGLRLFVDELLDPPDLVDYERRAIAGTLRGVEADTLMRQVSLLLSERTRQVGFVLTPRLDRLRLRHVSLVRLSSERILGVLITTTGAAHQRLIQDDAGADQMELDRVARALNERLAGRTLGELRRALAHEARTLRRYADRVMQRALAVGARLLATPEGDPELVLSNRAALFEHAEFRDPDRARALFRAIDTNEELVAYLDKMLENPGVCVAIGDELGEASLRCCAVVTAPYGTTDAPLGRLGVIGPSRMNYARVIPLVEYLSRLVTEKLAA